MMTARKFWIGTTITALFVLNYLVLANDGRHHWHEFRSLYSATHYSNAELMEGIFDPGPAPLRKAEEVAEWYSTKLFHIYLLRQFVNLFGPGLKTYVIIKVVYSMMIVMAVGLVVITLRNLGMSARRTALIAGLLLLSPVTIYLGFKLLEEAPSLLFSATALALFTASLRRSSHQIVLSGLAGIGLALSALSGWTVPILFYGFWLAYVLIGPSTRRSVRRASITTWAVFFPSMVIGLWLLSGSFSSYLNAISATLAFTKSLPMWMFAIFNLGLFGMTLWLVLPLAWLSPDYGSRRFFLFWLVLSGAPILFITGNFLEPRYLAPTLIPFAGLAALGFEALWDCVCRLNGSRFWRTVTVSVLGVVIIGGAAVAQPLMPYESETSRLIQAVQAEAPLPDSAVILVPWNYSDFHFLRFVFPERPIYLVQSAANVKGEAVDDPVWTSKFRAMYGDHYLPGAEDFPTEFSARKLLYVGWTVLPSLQNLHELFICFGFTRLAGYVEASRFRNHLSESWLVHDSLFDMREVARYGQYEIYHVRYRESSAQANQTAPSDVAPSQRIPLWGMFQTEFQNDRRYAKPFVDTELEATFFSPSGKTYNFFGFYDGDGNGGQNGSIWKLRFMCTEVGTWRWSAAFTDDSPGGSGSFHCVRSSLPGPLKVDKTNPHWLKKADGGHFLPRWYFLHELLFTKEEIWQRDIENLLVSNGYNMVTVLTTQAEHLIANGWNRQEYQQPLYYPWAKNGRTVLWNTMDLASWQKLDRVLQYLRDRNIYVYFFDGFFPNIAPRFPDNPIQERLYLRYALSRLGAYWNVTHNIAFEFSEFMSATRLNRVGRYIEEIDPFSLLLTVHDTQEFDELVRKESWVDFANLQYNGGTATNAAVSNAFVVTHSIGKPVAATEVVWEGTDKLKPDQVRRGAWGILMAGGFFLYGEFNLGGPGLGDFGLGKAHPFLKIMLDFMETVPYWEMSPHNEVVVDRASFCLADPRKEYVIYVESGGAVTVDLSAASGSLSVEWLNPRTGERSSAGTVVAGGPQRFKSPVTSEGDWVLHLGGSQRLDRHPAMITPQHS